MFSAFCRHRASAAGSAALVAFSSHSSPSFSSSSSSPTDAQPAASPPEWAHPSPYDSDVPPNRFASVEHLRRPQSSHQHPHTHWDLPALVNIWRHSSEESWPWVWCDHNPVGPHHIFINVSADTLNLTRAISQADARHNITVITNPDQLEKHGITEAQLYANRCGVIFVPLQQLDADSKMLMLTDERIIVYDYAYLS